MLTFDKLVRMFHQRLDQLPDHRKGGNNTTYDLKDAALGALAVFFTQSPSFLAHQKKKEDTKGRSNASTLFGIERTPSTPQIRDLLDPVSPQELYPMFRTILEALEENGQLAQFRAFNDSLLVALDGTQYFSSQKIHCEQCSQQQWAHTLQPQGGHSGDGQSPLEPRFTAGTGVHSAPRRSRQTGL